MIRVMIWVGHSQFIDAFFCYIMTLFFDISKIKLGVSPTQMLKIEMHRHQAIHRTLDLHWCTYGKIC